MIELKIIKNLINRKIYIFIKNKRLSTVGRRTAGTHGIIYCHNNKDNKDPYLI